MAVRCPGCDLQLPEDDGWAQARHMEAAHPEIIAARLRSAGFEREGGRWVDGLVADDGPSSIDGA